MDVGAFLSGMGRTAWLFIDAIPDALWIAYGWAKEWQTLLTGVLLLIAARTFSQGSVRTARIRATAMVRAAQIQAGEKPDLVFRPKASLQSANFEPPASPDSPEIALVQKIEELRSLIRSAMSTLTMETGKVDASPNFFCERIASLRFEKESLPTSLTPSALELHKNLVTQLAVVQQAIRTKVTQAELSQALVLLNARAREFAAALMPSTLPTTAIPSGTIKVRPE